MKKYQIIYADPPWQYKRWMYKNNRFCIDLKYNTMTTLDICNLPVKSISDKDCILFLWSPGPKINEALMVVDCWGFKYKSIGFTWVKRNKKSDSWFWGLGRWTRANAEYCLLATRGKPKRISAKVHSVLDDRIMEHSRKPNETKKRIVQLMGDLPRVELFARKPQLLFEDESFKGWDVWGNEVESDIDLSV